MAASTRRQKSWHLQSKYGITLEAAEALWEGQDGKCGCCREEIPAPGTSKGTVVDHCHETGAIRGILCRRCNNGIGILGDTLEAMLRAVEYLGG